MSGTRFIENISGVFLHLERRICVQDLFRTVLILCIFPLSRLNFKRYSSTDCKDSEGYTS